MSTWSEPTLRAAASWQAFKAGKRLADSGAASVATTTSNGYAGNVREGSRLHRVKVTLHSPTHLETRCSCPENQASGVLCAHAVAVGLVSLAAARPATTTAAIAPAAAAASVTAAAPVTTAVSADPATVALWSVALPPNWQEALARERLTPELRRAESESLAPPEQADSALAAWLAAAGVTTRKSPLHLQLAGAQVAGFLEALTEHPRVAAGGNPLAIAGHAQLPLSDLVRLDSSVRLVPDRAAAVIFRHAGRQWLRTPDGLGRLAAIPAELAAGKPLELPLADFLGQLENLQESLILPPDSWLDRIHFSPAPCELLLNLDGSLNQLKATLAVRYPGFPPLPPGQAAATGLPRLLAPDHCEIRNSAAETTALTALDHAGFTATEPALGRWSLQGETAIQHFLGHTLPRLSETWTVTESSSVAAARRRIQVLRPKLDIVGSGEDWLAFDFSFQADDGSLLPYREIQQLLRGGGRQPGTKTLVSSDLSDALVPLLGELELEQTDGHFVAKNLSIAVVQEIRNNLAKNHVSSDLQIPAVSLPESLTATLRPYQTRGFAWLVERMKRFKGALLADDMGLGKTIQTIALIEHLIQAPEQDQPDRRVLVVATASLLGNWVAEFERFAPGRQVHVLHGPKRDAIRERIGAGAVVLTSFATLPRDLAWHLRQDYLLVVVDEASLMRNPDTDHAKALHKLQASYRLALSGTPLENGVRDLWSIFRFILPGWLGDRSGFRERYEAPLSTTPPDPATLYRLRLKTTPFLLRRTKAEVAPDLPTKLMIDEFCDLSPQQQTVYQQLLREGRQRVADSRTAANPAAARFQLLTALLRLRQACCDLALLGNDRFKQMLVSERSAKLERLLELLGEALAGNHKVLIFSQFRTQLCEIEKQIQIRGWYSLRLDGQTRDRQRMVERFQSPDGPPLFLVSLKAGGYGLNLTAADTVIHFDPWWNPAVEAQATDRAHRIGQTRPVTVYRLLTRRTVEEKVLRLQARKRELAAFIDETGTGDAPSLSAADLQAILE